MPNPQQPELRRSGRVPALDPDATEAARSADGIPTSSPPTGPIPEEQRPGHHPAVEQDKPDLDAFAARLGVVDDAHEPRDAPDVTGLAAEARRRPLATTVGVSLAAIAVGGVVVRNLVRRLRGAG